MMASKCTKCGSEDNYNFALNIGMCNVCITKELERIKMKKQEPTDEQLKILRKDIMSGRVMIVEVEHYKKLEDNLSKAYKRIKELYAGAVQLVADSNKLQLEAADRIKELEAKIDIAQSAIETAKNHACPLCADYLNEAERALKG